MAVVNAEPTQRAVWKDTHKKWVASLAYSPDGTKLYASTLVTLRAEESRADEASAILRKAGAIDITRRAEDWRATGWMGDASAKGERARTRVQTPDVGEPMASSTGLSDSAWAMDEEIRSRAGPGTHIPR